MFAMDHAATALLLKRRYARVPLPALLLAVQLPELLWVALNFLGIERTTTDPIVRTVSGIHLSYMPWSHSVATMLGSAALLGALLWAATRRRDLAAGVALGIASHLVLDLATHAPDLALTPFVTGPKLGLGLYSSAPAAAFLLELAYGVFCWRVYRGSRALLITIVLFNLANASMFFAAVPGPEELAPRFPLLVPTLVLGQIVITLLLTGLLARNRLDTSDGRHRALGAESSSGLGSLHP